MAQKDIADRTDCATLCRRGAVPELRRGGSRRATPRRRGAGPELRALPNRAAAAKFQNCAAAAERADSPARSRHPPTPTPFSNMLGEPAEQVAKHIRE